jgi:hypothetical protein
MRSRLLPLLLTGCLAGGDGETYSCTSELRCDGGTWQVTPTRYCVADEAEAYERYAVYTGNLGATTKCKELHFVPSCRPLDVPCELR